MPLFDFLKKKAPKAIVTMSTHEYTPDELRQQQEDKVSEIRNLAQNSIPSKNGLRPHEIAMLAHATYYKTSGNDFPRYWYFDYGIDNPQAVLNMLLSGGFIRVAAAKESIQNLKVSELKDILSEFGVTSKGKKSNLIEAVLENISEEDFAPKISVRRYALTELGEQELKDNEYVTYFGGSSKYGMTVWDMNKVIQNYPSKLYRDRIWGHLNKKINEAMNILQKDGDMYSFYLREISVHYEMCKFLIEESRHPADALRLWSRATYYDLLVRATSAFKMTRNIEKTIGDNLSREFREILNLPFKVKDIKTLKEKIGLDDQQLFEDLISYFSECQPVDYRHMGMRNITRLDLEYEDIAGLVVAEVNGNEEIANTVYKNIERQIAQDKSQVWNK